MSYNSLLSSGVTKWSVESKSFRMVRSVKKSSLHSLLKSTFGSSYVPGSDVSVVMGSRPSHSELLTLNRSPHGNKKHRDQFVMTSRVQSVVVKGKKLSLSSLPYGVSGVTTRSVIRYGGK